VISHLAEELPLAQLPPFLRGASLNAADARACMFADTLSWAVRHGVPLGTALRSLPFYRGRPGLRDVVKTTQQAARSFVFRAGCGPSDYAWSRRLRRLVRDVEDGAGLALAMQRHFGGVVPDFYILGVARAERLGQLETALPLLAHALTFPASAAGERREQVWIAAWKLAAAVVLVGFVLTNVVPRFEFLLDEMGAPLPPAPVTIFRVLGGVLGWAAFAAAVLFAGARIQWFREHVLIHVPVVGRELRRFRVSGAALSMAAFVRAGEDIVAAADWSAKATRSAWLRQRLAAFRDGLRAGVSWPDAWVGAGLASPMHEWALRNADLREDPASGFETCADWLQQEIACTTRRIARWVDPLFTVLLAAAVGTLAVSIFAAMTQLVGVYL
jgi:type II secretory pathway component PulF